MNVQVEYRNAKMELVSTQLYDLTDYTAMLKADLLRLITDVEDLCYSVNGNRPKEEWSDASWS